MCERALRSRFTLREEGQVELLRKTPNGLSASNIVYKFRVQICTTLVRQVLPYTSSVRSSYR